MAREKELSALTVGGEKMAMVQVGVTAVRKPNGEFCPSTPVYREIPNSKMRPSGLTTYEEIAFSDLEKILAKKFKQYKDGLKTSGIEKRKGN